MSLKILHECKNTQNSTFCDCDIVTLATDQQVHGPRGKEDDWIQRVGTNSVMMEILKIIIATVVT